MRLGIDMDGVIANFNDGWITRYNAQFDAEVRLEQIDHWGAIPSITHFRHMGEFWRWSMDLDGASLFRWLEPFPGAIDALNRLAKAHKIVIVTTKPHFAIHDTYGWLSEHKVPTTEVHITENKWEVPCDVYLEDGPHNLIDLVEHRPESIVCRYIRPWNAPLPGTTPISDFAQFEDLIASL